MLADVLLISCKHKPNTGIVFLQEKPPERIWSCYILITSADIHGSFVVQHIESMQLLIMSVQVSMKSRYLKAETLAVMMAHACFVV